MPNLPISQFTSITGADVDVDTDELYITDPSAAVAARSKKITVKELVANTKSFLQSGNGAPAFVRTVNDRLREKWSILDAIPLAEHSGLYDGTNVDDMATYVQDLIDYLTSISGHRAKIIEVPDRLSISMSTITLKERVIMRGGDGIQGAVLTHLGSGVLIDTPTGADTYYTGLKGFSLEGNANTTYLFRMRDVLRGIARDLFFNNCQNAALLVGSDSGNCILRDIYVNNACKDTAGIAAITGAVDIDGTDHQIHNVKGNPGLTAISSASLYIAGFCLRGDEHYVSHSNGEFGDVGMYLLANHCRLSNCRADLNWGHGLYLQGDGNEIVTFKSRNNSQGTTNTYDNFIADSGAGQNLLSACRALSNVAKVARYGFNDAVNSATDKNRYDNCFSSGAGTKDWNVGTSAGSAVGFPSGTNITLTVNSTTPSVAQHGRFQTANTSNTTITDFTNGVDGQEITVTCLDATSSKTTIQHNGSTISMLNAGNLKLKRLATYHFVRSGGLWREVVAWPLGVTTDAGDAAKTLQARIDEETQIWATELTADRAVTLSTTGAYAGAEFEILRPAAGAFNLNVGTGPLYALAVGEACRVKYNGSAWIAVQKWTI